jgi:hypothetical protein
MGSQRGRAWHLIKSGKICKFSNKEIKNENRSRKL